MSKPGRAPRAAPSARHLSDSGAPTPRAEVVAERENLVSSGYQPRGAAAGGDRVDGLRSGRRSSRRAVQIAQRCILARMRNETFHSPAAMNARIRELLADLNARTMRRYVDRGFHAVMPSLPAVQPVTYAGLANVRRAHGRRARVGGSGQPSSRPCNVAGRDVRPRSR